MPDLFERGFFVREPAWHGKGIVLSEYPGRDEAMRLAGHDFKVESRPAFFERIEPRNANIGVPYTERIAAESWQAIVRGDTGELLTFAKKSYEPVQNATAWDVVDAIVQQPNVHYDTAGVLNGGAVLWVMAYLDEPAKVVGDPSPLYPYIAASWSHDGTGALTVDRTTVRRVCMNTHRAASAEADRTGRVFRFRHTKNVMSRIEDAKEALAGLRAGFRAFIDLANELAAMPVSDEGIEAFVKAFRTQPDDAALISDRVKANIEDDRTLVRSYLNGPTCEGIRNTAWGLVSAGVEFLDYGRKYRSNATLLNRTVLKGEPLKDAVVALAKRAATAYPA